MRRPRAAGAARGAGGSGSGSGGAGFLRRNPTSRRHSRRVARVLLLAAVVDDGGRLPRCSSAIRGGLLLLLLMLLFLHSSSSSAPLTPELLLLLTVVRRSPGKIAARPDNIVLSRGDSGDRGPLSRPSRRGSGRCSRRDDRRIEEGAVEERRKGCALLRLGDEQHPKEFHTGRAEGHARG